MTPTQRAAAERLIDDRLTATMEWSRQVVALLRELLAAEPVQEPVALMWQHEETGRVTFTTMADPYVGKRWHRIPLYAAAPQQPMRCPEDGGACGAGGYCRPEPQQRKPLTREQIDTVWSSLGSFTDRESDYRIFARAIERAHGITGEQK